MGFSAAGLQSRGRKETRRNKYCDSFTKKQKTGSNPQPTLAPELDELNQFVETVAAEEEVKNPDTSFVTRVFQPDTDDDPGDPDLDILTDFNDEDSEISDSEGLSENGDDGAPFNFQMDPGVIDTLVANVEHAHNAEPMESDRRFGP